MPFDQTARHLQIATPLGENVLLLTGFQGNEAMSQIFRLELKLISEDSGLKPEDLVGQPISIRMRVDDDNFRHLHGHISRFGVGGVDHKGRRDYWAEVVPWLWFLKQTRDSRIFQDKSLPEILEQIFHDLGFQDFELRLSGHHPQREYCVQYQETDFDFVSRLMEEEGVFYYFRHEERRHVMVIADQATSYFPCPGGPVNFPTDAGVHALADHLTDWEHRYEFQSGRWSLTDYNFKTPTTKLETKSKSMVSLPGIDAFEVYEYPGRYGTTGDGQPIADQRMAAREASYDVAQGSSTCRAFAVGGTFEIGSHQDKQEEGKKFVLTRVEHNASEGASYETGTPRGFEYRNTFHCIPDRLACRPELTTEKPFMRGPQTAVVVGPAGEEIHVDDLGRVRAQFHWDREGKFDESSCCWMRVSQIHAGRGFGAIDIPRVGEEVIVSFLDGDPDRPLITGRVYHAENMPPFPLPDSKTISGMRTKTYKGDGYNEYVMDDTPGNELIREHGQYDKDSTIENDLREHVLNNRERDVSVDETVSIGSNQAITIGADQTTSVGANQTLEVGGDRGTLVGGNRQDVVKGSRVVSIDGADQLDVAGSQTINVTGAIEISSASVIRLMVGGSAIEIGPAGIKIVSSGIVEIQGAIIKENC